MSGGSAASTARDVLIALALVGAVLGTTFLYAGSWPPILVVESGSMMHCEVRAPACALVPQGLPYGRYGTIDPGDIVVQKRIKGKEDVRTWVEGGPLQYGKPGDVIVFYAFNNTNSTPIIHRAMTWVDVTVTPRGPEYRVDWVEGQVRTFDARGIYLPELGFDERAGFTPANGYRPIASGFITKGDNPITNDRADQAAARPEERLTELVQPGWISGKAKGEIPWFGLVKLVFTPNKVNNPNPFWIRVGNTYAPYDLWTMLGFVIALVVIAPLAYDVVRAWREQRAIRRDLERERREERRAAEEAAAAEARQAPSGPDPPPFEPVD